MKRRIIVLSIIISVVLLSSLSPPLSAAMKLSMSDGVAFQNTPLAKQKDVANFVSSVPACTASNRNECPRYYLSGDKQSGLVEVCLPWDNHPRGLYLFNPSGAIHYYEWYDAKFNEWSCSEGCAEKSDCYYTAPGAAKDGTIHELEYHYRTNLTHGSYKLQTAPDHKLKVLKNQSKDEPS